MTQDQIDRIKAYCEKATPGPWSIDDYIVTPREADGLTWHLFESAEDDPPLATFDYLSPKENAFFCANARTDIPLLLEALEQLRKERDELRAVLLRCRDTVGIYISCAGHHSDGDDPCPRCEIASQIKKVLSTT